MAHALKYYKVIKLTLLKVLFLGRGKPGILSHGPLILGRLAPYRLGEMIFC